MTTMTDIATRYAARMAKRSPQVVKNKALASSFGNLLQSSLSAFEISFLSEDNATLVYYADGALDTSYAAILEDKVELDKLKDAETRKVLVHYDQSPPIGGIFHTQDSEWLVAKQETLSNTAYKRYHVKKCNYVLKWIDSYGNKISQPCIVYDYTLYSDGVDEKLNIATGDTKVGILIPLTTDTAKWHRDARFIIGDATYKLAKQDAYTNVGVKTVVMKEVESSSLDDFENGYAYDEITSVYTIEFESSTAEIGYNNYKQLSTIVNKDGEVVQSNITWKSSNDSIVTVDSNGMIYGQGYGNATITATLDNNNLILDTIVVYVKSNTTSLKTYKLVGDDFIKYGRTETYELKEFVDGVENTLYGEDLTFSIDDGSSVILVNSGINTCTLKASTYNKSVTLSVTKDLTTYDKTIELKSLI